MADAGIEALNDMTRVKLMAPAPDPASEGPATPVIKTALRTVAMRNLFIPKTSGFVDTTGSRETGGGGITA